MVRKKRSVTDQRLTGTASPALNAEVETWLARIRDFLPDPGTAVVTVHELPRHRFLVSFRASALGETFISEARESSLEDAVRQAGERLLERLQASPLGSEKKKLAERVREFFGEGP